MGGIQLLRTVEVLVVAGRVPGPAGQHAVRPHGGGGDGFGEKDLVLQCDFVIDGGSCWSVSRCVETKPCGDDGALAGSEVAIGIPWGPGRFEGEPEFGQEPCAWLPAFNCRSDHLGVVLCGEFTEEGGGHQTAQPLAPICRVDEEQAERATVWRRIPEHGVDHADDSAVDTSGASSSIR